MVDNAGPRARYGEAFWRAHHEAWKRSDLNQREYCEAQGIPLKAFGNWRATGLCLFTKRLEHGVFLWPPTIEPGRTLALTSAQLSALLEGIDWRCPERQWRPAVAG